MPIYIFAELKGNYVPGPIDGCDIVVEYDELNLL